MGVCQKPFCWFLAEICGSTFLGKPRGVTTKFGTFWHQDATAVTFAAVTCLAAASLCESARLKSYRLD